jgi:hypothetical protein
MKLTSDELYMKLTVTDGLVGKTGEITFTFNNHPIKIESKDIIGNVIQDWIKDWMRSQGVSFIVNQNSQKFPDIYLDPDSKTTGLLEIKAFDFERSPNFDIANFDSYCNSLITDSYRIDSDYLIVGYSLHGATITIKNIWKKKIWEISGPSEKWPIKVQEKRETIYNLRPSTWYSTRSKFKSFNNKETFLSALNDTRYQYGKTRLSNSHWLSKVLANYLTYTGVKLIIPQHSHTPQLGAQQSIQLP